jgi:hypothetical protein
MCTYKHIHNYYDMKPKSQNLGVREVSQRHPLVQNGLLKHVSVAINMHTKVEELLGQFSDKANTKLHKQSQPDPGADNSHSRESCGTWNQE